MSQIPEPSAPNGQDKDIFTGQDADHKDDKDNLIHIYGQFSVQFTQSTCVYIVEMQRWRATCLIYTERPQLLGSGLKPKHSCCESTQLTTELYGRLCTNSTFNLETGTLCCIIKSAQPRIGPEFNRMFDT